MLNIQKTTSDGRFIVSIESRTLSDTPLMTTECAESLKELSEILSRASELALECAIKILSTQLTPRVIP